MTDQIQGLPAATLLDWSRSPSGFDSGTRYAQVTSDGKRHRVGDAGYAADLADAIQAAEILWLAKAPIEQLRLRLVALGGKRPSFRWIEDENGWTGFDGHWTIYASRPDGIAGKVAGVLGKIPLPFVKKLPAVIDPDYAKAAAERSWLIARLYQALAASRAAENAEFVDRVFAPVAEDAAATVASPAEVATPPKQSIPETATVAAPEAPAPVAAPEAKVGVERDASTVKPARRRPASKIAPTVASETTAIEPPVKVPAKRGRPSKAAAAAKIEAKGAAVTQEASPAQEPAAKPKRRPAAKKDTGAASVAPKAPRAARKPKKVSDIA